MESTIDFRTIRQLWMFLAVAEEQHFGRAAARLNMSQPPLTEQIKQLESALDLQLFIRSRRGTTLSPSGSAILPAVKQFAEQIARLERVVREVAAGQSDVMHIGAITSAMFYTVPALLDDLRRRHPNRTLIVKQIGNAEAFPKLLAGEIDLAFLRPEGKAVRGISMETLTEERVEVAMPKDHPLARLPRVRVRSIADEPLVVSSRETSPAYFDTLMSLCRSHGFVPRIAHETTSVMSKMAYVNCGQGIALVSASDARLAPPNVVVRPLKERVMVDTAALAWRTDRHHPMVEATVDWIRKHRRQRSGARSH